MAAYRRVTGWGLALSLAAVAMGAGPAQAAHPVGIADAGTATQTTTTTSTTTSATTTVGTGVTHAQNPSVPEGAAWTEEYFPSSLPSNNGDQVMLHADVLRPADLGPDDRTPVIMSIGPYFSHSGQNADTDPAYAGPSTRFTDLIDGGRLMDSGYTFVYVDLRGFGASTGCLDWIGPGEQADVVSAVEWAAGQSWSTGAVGLYGKSYDASTGLIGVNLQPEGLKAVVAQEPNWSGYDYLVTNGVSRVQQVLSPEAYISIAGLPGVDHAYHQDGYDIPADTDTYLARAAYERTHPECAESLMADTKDNDRTSAFWSIRDLPANVDGSTVPLMFTQGLTERNTKPEGMQEYLSHHAGEQRAWLGPWDHVRGNEVDAEGRLQMGRSTWFAEVMDFYDAHLKQQTPTISSSFFVQDNAGAWRVQDSWGTTDKTAVIPLRTGSYLDTGRGHDGPGTPEPNPNPLLLADDADEEPVPSTPDRTPGIMTLSDPVRTAVRLTGTPVVELHTQGAGNVAVQLYDMAPDRSAVMIDYNVSTLSTDGVTRLGLLALDWTLAAGHSLVVSVDTIDWGDWVPTPSGAEVVVHAGTVSIPVESTAHDVRTDGSRAPFLDTYIADNTRDQPIPDIPATFVLSAATGQILSDVDSVHAGDEVVIDGSGYDPGAPVAVSWQNDALATPVAEEDGTFRLAVTVPSTAEPGIATIAAVAEDGGRAILDITVTAAIPAPIPSNGVVQPAALAATGGGDGAPLAIPGAALAILLGLSLALVRTRSRRAAR